MTARRGGLHLLEVNLRWPPETFLRAKLEGLARWGLRVTVVSTVRRAEAVTSLRGVRVRRVPDWRESRALKLLGVLWRGALLAVSDPGVLRRLVAGIRGRADESRRKGLWQTVGRLRIFLPLARLHPDVVQFEWESAAVFHLPLLDVWRCPMVVSCHGAGINVHPHTPQYQRWLPEYPTIFRKASAIHCVSHAVAREALQYGADPTKVVVIGPAVDTEFFRPAPRPTNSDGELRIVAVGDLIWIKGYVYALQALRFLLDAGVEAHLDIVGGEPPGLLERREQDVILFTIHDLGLTDRVRLHGELGPDRVREQLHGADVLLHTSVSEGIPTVVLEAMACGLPVVVGDCGGLREAVTDGVEGFVVPTRAPRESARALQRLAEDPPLRRELGRAGRARVEAAFTVDAQVERFAELYERLARSRS